MSLARMHTPRHASFKASESTKSFPVTASYTRTVVSTHPTTNREWSNATAKAPTPVLIEGGCVWVK